MNQCAHPETDLPGFPRLATGHELVLSEPSEALTEIYMRTGEIDKCTSILARLVDTVPPEDFVRHLNGIHAGKSIVDIIPDTDLLLPFLAKAYRSRVLLLQKNLDYCLEATLETRQPRSDKERNRQ